VTVNHWVVGSSPTLGAMLIDPELRLKNPIIGKRVQLINCTDEFTLLKYGDLGTVTFVDDTGTVFVNLVFFLVLINGKLFMTNIFQNIIFGTRSNDGVTQEHPSLNDALETFMADDGYRIDFIFPDGKVLYIHRAEYGEDIDFPYNDHPSFKNYNIANAKVLVYNPQSKPQDTFTNVIPLFQ
jgi:hypothetical protein